MYLTAETIYFRPMPDERSDIFLDRSLVCGDRDRTFQPRYGLGVGLGAGALRGALECQ